MGAIFLTMVHAYASVGLASTEPAVPVPEPVPEVLDVDAATWCVRDRRAWRWGRVPPWGPVSEIAWWALRPGPTENAEGSRWL